MDTQVESELRVALAAKAAELPSDASRRLLDADYRPRPGLRRPAIAATVAAAVAGAVAAVLLVSVGTNPPRAFAGWSATPTASSGNQAQSAREACLSRLRATSTRIAHARDTDSGRHEPRLYVPDGGWHTALTDRRGPYTEILFVAANGSAELSCFSGRQPAQVALGGSFGIHAPTPVPAGHISTVSSGSRTTPADEGSKQFQQLVGRTGPGVVGVTLKLRDGTRVIATVANGWFLAWWPGTQGGNGIEVTTSTATGLKTRVIG